LRRDDRELSVEVVRNQSAGSYDGSTSSWSWLMLKENRGYGTRLTTLTILKKSSRANQL
jgi:hypothetical protein